MASELSAPDVSVVVVVYNMAREAPRTLFTLSAACQRPMAADRYEVIVVDNGSTPPFDPHALDRLDGHFRLIRIDDASASPAEAVNRGLALARGALIGVMIDGARMASPGLLAGAASADRLRDRAAILTMGFHLGPGVQMESVRQGYDAVHEDRLLERSGWREDGYRLFDISVFAGSSAGGWHAPMAESNAIFMRRALWDELGGMDERFRCPGGGLVNLDLLARAVEAADAVVTILGEGTFHQVHGGVATNAHDSPWERFHAEYQAIRGRPWRQPAYRSLYVGAVPEPPS